MDKAQAIGDAVWQVVLIMAPYLLLGFAVAGVLSVALTPEWVARHLGRKGVWQVIKAALLGVPLPLCSCGVIPLAFSLRKSGAGKGATVSFLASTPQTGVDSILLTYSLLGPVIALLRVAAAFVSGIAAGVLTDWLCGDDAPAPAPAAAEKPACCCGGKRADRAGCAANDRGGNLNVQRLTPNAQRPSFQFPVSSYGQEPTERAVSGGEACCADEAGSVARAAAPASAWRRALRHGFVTLPRDMARPLLLGVLVSGVVSGLVPEGFFAGRLPPGVASYALALVVGIPIYVCSASSVPIAATFIHMGVSPGVAMVFLIAGPATNAAAVLAMWKQIGRAGTAVYLGVIAAVSLLAGVVLDGLLHGVRETVPLVRAAHDHVGSGPPWHLAAAVLLLALLLPGVWRHADDDEAVAGAAA